MQWKAQQQSYILHYPEAEHMLVLHEELPVGRIIVARYEDKLHLVDISLLPNYQHQGIGTFLLERLQKEAAVKQQVIHLSMLHGNRALHLYQRLGFKQTASDEVYLQMCWSPVKGGELS